LGKDELKKLLSHLRNEKQGRRGNENGVAQRTINAYYSALSSFYNYLVYEEYVDQNPVPPFRKRYLKDQSSDDGEDRQLISVSEMAGLIMSIIKTRDKAVILLLAKTGIRRGELVRIDLDDINWEKQSIKLKPTPKRSNQTVYFDDECARILKNWKEIRDEAEPDTNALFINQEGDRLQRNGVYNLVTKHAEKVGIHDPESDDLEDRFTPHCTRHWFTTHLRRSEMRWEHVKELRGDIIEDSMGPYNHIDHEELRESYLSHIPKLQI
jgi:integrase/recombinase XerD